MFRFALACCCALVTGVAPAGAQTAPPQPSPAPAAAATGVSPEAAKIAAAMAKVTSFRVQLSSGGGFGGTITAVLLPQKRTKAVVAMGTTVREMVMADGRSYMRTNGGAWRIDETPGGGGLSDTVLKAMGDPSSFRVLPDRVENGTAFGVYEVTVPLPPGAPAGLTVPPLSCTYDKTTYLPRVCTIQSMTQTFEGWNDPANVIDIPVVPSPRP